MNPKMFDKVKEQSVRLIEQFGEFYPIAFGFSSNSEIIPVVTFFEEFPQIDKYYSDLVSALNQSNNHHSFSEVIICSNVSVGQTENEDAINALEFKFDSLTEERKNLYMPYIIVNGKMQFQEGYYTEGTLEFFN
ncbi:MAG TPA: hypothetical protein PKN75_15075 [Bacteroidia bacterium]|nr:hypothetical protein [Bacteroidia bacterium]HNU34908.1 hypothetical protein [Bacteroidia bacterium]